MVDSKMTFLSALLATTTVPESFPATMDEMGAHRDINLGNDGTILIES